MNRFLPPLWTVALGALVFTAQAEPIELRTPHRVTYELELPSKLRSPAATNWVTGIRVGQKRPVEFGRRVVVQTRSTRVPAFRRLTPQLRIQQRVNDRTWLLEAANAHDAVQSAALLALDPEIESATPTTRRRVQRHFPIAPSPNDRYFDRQYSLQARDPSSPFLPISVDLNAREAWAYSRGENVIIGVGDDGIEGTHPDLAANFAGPNHNYLTGADNGDPVARSLFHGTAVAGLIAAVGDNHIGLTGIAPRAKLASWVIFDDTDTNQPDEAGFAALFGTANQEVGVQNHSWGNADTSFVEVSLLEHLAIEKAVVEGRGGRGVVIVRSAGNTRQAYTGAPTGDANLDGYANDPRQVAVAAVRPDGRVTSYSTPGSCVLVAAPGGDYRGGYPGLITTDRTGFAGLNAANEPDDPTAYDYLVGTRLFVGTSAAAPLVAGVAALVISTRPELRWFDVQQILALSARHLDLADPELRTNGAGLRVSPNVGFGIPDAGVAVRLARIWALQATPEKVAYTNSGSLPIPDPPTNAGAPGLRYQFAVTNSLILQHVQVHVRWSHTSGHDLRLDLTSPSGLTSPLLRPGSASEPVPDEWTFSSAEYLGETSYGTWVLEITDTSVGETGQVDEASLVLDGRAIEDVDHDGLDDAWEQRWFGSLAPGPTGDPDGDGWNNAAEQMAGRDPTRRDEEFQTTVAKGDDGRVQLSWPAASGDSYQVWGTTSASEPLTLRTNVPGRFPEAGWLLDSTTPEQLLEVRRVP